ncbi:MAG: SPOR domain-containing protein [Prevotellaceae bacterium]|jgi:cell division protein FtsN|nr:SPOR domain-containing protein [Prevotellaceae bacterium]
MRKRIIYPLILLFSILAVSACSSSKSTTKITGANKVAGGIQQPSVSPSVSQSDENIPALHDEVTRTESFILAEGENPRSDTYKKHYHVVVGSFKSRDNAKGLQASLNSEGNEATVVVNETGMYRVILASFNEYLQARACINNVAGRFPDAWVLVNAN